MKHLLFVFLFSALSTAASAATHDEKLRSLAKPLEKDIVYYRWQSTQSGENLAKLGKLNEKTNKYFMNLKENVVAGPGIYMALGPSNSASYLPNSGGNLLEIRVAKGTPYIDLTDSQTKQKMLALGLSEADVKKSPFSKEGAVVKYTDTWLVGKNLTGKADFELYPGKSQTAESIVRGLESLKYYSEAYEQAIDQLRKNPEKMAPLYKAIGVLDKESLLRIAPPDYVLNVLRNEASLINNTQSADRILKVLSSSQSIVDTLESEPELLARTKAQLIRHASPEDYGKFAANLSPHWSIDYIKNLQTQQSIAQVATRYLDAKTVGIKDNAEFARQIRSYADTVSEIVKKDESTLKVLRGEVSELINLRIARSRMTDSPAEPLAQLLEERYLGGRSVEDQQAKLKSAIEFKKSVSDAANSPSRETVEKAVREAKSAAELIHVSRNLHSKGASAFKEVVYDNADLVLQLALTGSGGKKYLGNVISDLEHNHGINMRPLIQKWAQTAPPEALSQGLEQCLRSEICRDLMRYQWGELVKRVEDFSPLRAVIKNSRSVYRSGIREFDQIERAIFKAIRTPAQFASFDVEASFAIDSKARLAKIEEIGLDKFRPTEVLSAVDLEQNKLSAAKEKQLLMQLISTAVNQEDIRDIEARARLSKLDRTEVGARLERRAQELKPDSAEVLRWELRTGRTSLKPAAGFDCVSSWAQALGK